MIATLLTLGLFSFHFSPYVQVEKSFLKYNCEDTVVYGEDYVIFQKEDIFALGATFEEKYLWTNLSFGGALYELYEDIKFLPYFDINTGIKWRNYTGYVGYVLPGKHKAFRAIGNWYEIQGLQSIFTGISANYQLKKLRLGFGLQLRREQCSYTLHSFMSSIEVDTSYISTFFTSIIGYMLGRFNPFLFLSLNSKAISLTPSLKVGLGINLGNPLFVSGKYQKVIVYHQVMIRKPNIYLYPVKPCSVAVMLEPDGRLTVSDPPYQNGWNVYAFPDGTIQNSLGYLFYEAKINKMRVTDKGWCITKDEVTSFFFSILYSYGFNQRETNDFVSYWRGNLPDSPYYVIYPAVNKEIDKVCPLTVYPSPDVVLRVWFVVESVKTPVSLDAPAIPSFKRNGFVVTEWGVILERSEE
ncbi:MAG: hypothetical protein E3J87_09600 [Candidatus Cloacimonadota bacterium]|nr:MAG: hypothetical protein E3J87_09600 [Candidatus Cloacimonadota bacterium]